MLGSEAVTVPPLADLQRRRSAKWREYPADVLPLHIAETDFDLALPVRAVLEEAVRWSDTGYPSGAAEAAAALARACSTLRAPGMTVETPGCWMIQRSAAWAGVIVDGMRAANSWAASMPVS